MCCITSSWSYKSDILTDNFQISVSWIWKMATDLWTPRHGTFSWCLASMLYDMPSLNNQILCYPFYKYFSSIKLQSNNFIDSWLLFLKLIWYTVSKAFVSKHHTLPSMHSIVLQIQLTVERYLDGFVWSFPGSGMYW